MYHLGQGLTQDYKQAAAWYRRAAEQGHAEAQYYLGLIYAKGQGMQEDYKEAYAWVSVSIANGKDGVKMRDAIAEVLTADQLEQAQQTAAQYFEQYQSRK
ncbi:Localization factor PodJL [compost metagenome]